jgi:ADP-heptose:LPS heptosyltransferase
MSYQNILLIQLFRIGDIIQVFPLVQSLKRTYPGVRISFMVSKTFRTVAEHNADIDEIIEFPWEDYKGELQKSVFPHRDVFSRLEQWVESVTKRKFDLIINLQHLFFGPLLSFLMTSEERKGPHYTVTNHVHINDPWTKYFYVISKNRQYNSLNFSEIYARIGACNGMYSQGIITITPQEEEHARALLSAAGIEKTDTYITIQPGASKEYKRWPYEYFSALMSYLIAQTPHKIVIVGSEQEAAQFSPPVSSRMVNLMGKTRFADLAVVLQESKLLITNDTGTMHVAAAVNTPTLTLSFGMTHPRETAPYAPGHLCLQARKECCPCLDPLTCSEELLCRVLIKPNDVFTVVKSFLEKGDRFSSETTFPTYDLYVSQEHRGVPQYFLHHVKSVETPFLLQEILRYSYSEIWMSIESETTLEQHVVDTVVYCIRRQYNYRNEIDNAVLSDIFTCLEHFRSLLLRGKEIIISYLREIENQNKGERRKMAVELEKIDGEIRQCKYVVGPLSLRYDLEVRLIMKEKKSVEELLRDNGILFDRILQGATTLESVVQQVCDRLFFQSKNENEQ